MSNKKLSTLSELYKDTSAEELIKDLLALKEKQEQSKSPDEDEFQAYLKILFTQYIQAKVKNGLSIFEKVFEGKSDKPSMSYETIESKLKSALDIISIIEKCETDEEIYKTFQPEKLKEILTDIENVLTTVEAISEATGFSAANDESYMMIMPKLHSSHLPSEDFDIAERMNIKNPKEYFDGMLFKIKHTVKETSKGKGVIFNEDFTSPEMTKMVFTQAKQRISEKKMNIDVNIPNKPKRKWWGGIGTIVIGVGTVAGNISLAITARPVAIAGAIPSTATEIGVMIEGIGKIQGE